MKPEDIQERSDRKALLLLGVQSMERMVKLNCWNAARATISQLDHHLRQIELIELQEREESKNSRDAATSREP